MTTDSVFILFLILPYLSTVAGYQYVLTITTGDEEGAGTDADVFITMIGVTGSSEEMGIFSRSAVLFQRNEEDAVNLNFKACVGEMLGVRIRHDNTGDHPAWLLHRVEIEDVQLGVTYQCPADVWISEGHGGASHLLRCHSSSIEHATEECVFGVGCLFPCLCENCQRCDPVTGECPSGCYGSDSLEKDWSGPGCQVGNIAHARGSGGEDTMKTSNSGNWQWLVDAQILRTKDGLGCFTPETAHSWYRITFDADYVIYNITTYYSVMSQNVVSTEFIYDVQEGSRYVMCSPYIRMNIRDDMWTTTAICEPPRKARAVRMRMRTEHRPLIYLCEIAVTGYLLQECPEDRYGPGCLLPCNCSHNCDDITGKCCSDRKVGYHCKDLNLAAAIGVGIAVIGMLLAFVAIVFNHVRRLTRVEEPAVVKLENPKVTEDKKDKKDFKEKADSQEYVMKENDELYEGVELVGVKERRSTRRARQPPPSPVTLLLPNSPTSPVLSIVEEEGAAGKKDPNFLFPPKH